MSASDAHPVKHDVRHQITLAPLKKQTEPQFTAEQIRKKKRRERDSYTIDGKNSSLRRREMQGPDPVAAVCASSLQATKLTASCLVILARRVSFKQKGAAPLCQNPRGLLEENVKRKLPCVQKKRGCHRRDSSATAISDFYYLCAQKSKATFGAMCAANANKAYIFSNQASFPTPFVLPK